MINYPRPPVVEAVIEFVTETRISSDTLDAMATRLASEYPEHNLEKDIEVRIDGTGAAPTVHTSDESQRHRLTSDDQADIVIFSPTNLATVRLGSYQGWDSLYQKARRNWRLWSKGPAGRKISRIGLRYINRLDIPNDGRDEMSLHDYLTFVPLVPPISQKPMASFLIQVTKPTIDPNWDANLLSTIVVPSPLVNHMSILLDIDVFRTRDIPSKESEMFEVLQQGRNLKNSIFETCVTNTARALFK